MKKKITLIAILLAAVLGGCSATETTIANREDVAVSVHTQNIEKTDIRNEMSYAGQIRPQETLSVVSAMAGKVESTYFEIGDTVNIDDVLFRLDRRNIEDQIRQLNAQIGLSNAGIRSAQTGLANVTGGQTQSQILQMETSIEGGRSQVENAELQLKNVELQAENAGIQLRNAQTALENAQTTYNNIKTLYESGVATKNQFDEVELLLSQRTAGVEQAQIAYDAALLGHDSAIIAYETAQMSLSQAERSLEIMTGQIIAENEQNAQLGIDQALASKESVLVQLDIANSTLRDADVKSPISGVVSAKNANAGEMISQSVAAYTIVNMDMVTVDVRISELLINRIWTGQEVNIFIHSLGEEPLKGIIKTISPVADATSTFPVKIEIDNADGVIKPGMFAEVRLVREESNQTIVVDRNVVLADENSSFVFVNDNGFAKRVEVLTGIDNGRQIEIIQGIDTTDEIIVRGQNYVKNGEGVNVVN